MYEDMKPQILITNPLHEVPIAYLKRHTDVTIAYDIDERELLKKVINYDALIVRSATRVRSCILTDGARKRLRVVGTATAGFNHINLETAKKLNIPVVYSPWGNTLANAEFIIGAMIALSRNITRSDRLIRRGKWNQEAGIGPELSGKIFGTIGFGRIGSLAAEKARLLGMKILAYDPVRPEYEFNARGAKKVTLPYLLRHSDFVSVSVPLNESTRGLIGERELQFLKPTAYIIQSSRGGTIDEETLLQYLEKRKIRGAFVDVFKEEPQINPRFLKLENVILTPHIGCSSEESRVRSGMAVARGVLNILRGSLATNRIV